MPSAAIIAAALTDHSARAKSLTIDGLDVLLEPGTGPRYGVRIESVSVTEAGPGGVSAMEFTIEDPGLEVGIAKGARVLFWDHTSDNPIFRGYVQSWAPVPQATWRRYEVRCIGTEAILDWGVLTYDVTAVAAPDWTLADAIQQVCAAASMVPPRIACEFPTNNRSSQAYPLSAETLFTQVIDAVTIPAGTTLREAIMRVIAGSYTNWSSVGRWVVTVDFWEGLRVYNGIRASGPPAADFRALTVSDTVGGTYATSNLDYTVEGISTHSVYITGGNAAGSGLVPDGTGLPGPTAAISDSTITTAETKQSAAIDYLSQNATGTRASFTLESVTPASLMDTTDQVRVGSELSITDAQAGLSGSSQYWISEITKTFDSGGTETWLIHFGGPPSSLVRKLRQLTRQAREVPF